MGAWRTIRHRLEAAAPDGVPVALCRPAVARQPERGVPDRAQGRAGPHRPRGAGPRRVAARALACGGPPGWPPRSSARACGPRASSGGAARAVAGARGRRRRRRDRPGWWGGCGARRHVRTCGRATVRYELGSSSELPASSSGRAPRSRQGDRPRVVGRGGRARFVAFRPLLPLRRRLDDRRLDDRRLDDRLLDDRGERASRIGGNRHLGLGRRGSGGRRRRGGGRRVRGGRRGGVGVGVCGAGRGFIGSGEVAGAVGREGAVGTGRGAETITELEVGVEALGRGFGTVRRGTGGRARDTASSRCNADHRHGARGAIGDDGRAGLRHRLVDDELRKRHCGEPLRVPRALP